METGEAIHSFISNLVQRRAPGIQALCFLGVKTCGTTQLLHSLFSLPQGPYDESTPRLCALVDDVPADGFPTIALLTPMAFASNEPFPDSSEEYFESHVTGLPSTLLRNLDTNAMQAASVADEGTRTINSRGLTFLSGANLALLLQLGFSPTISAAACALAPHLLHSDEPHADLAFQWIQASFTKRDDGKFIGGPIRTRREIPTVDPDETPFTLSTVTAHLQRSLPARATTYRIRGGVSEPLLESGGLPHPTPPSGRAATPPPGPSGTEGRVGDIGGGNGSASVSLVAPPPPPTPPPPPFNVDIAAIVAAAVTAATQGIAAATAASGGPGVTTPQATLSPLKLLHLRMVCGVATDQDIPGIWEEVGAASNKQAGLAMLVQYLMGDMRVCRRTYLGHSDLLHCSIPLYNFVAGDRFVNPGENPACPAGGMSMWTTLQGLGDIGDRMASADADLTALDGRNALADQVARAAKVHLQPISGASNLQKEIGTKTYILSKLFGEACPLVEGYTSVVTWIDENFASFERQVATPAQCTSFAYDLSRTEAAYYNACIRSSTTAHIDDPGGRIPVSFAMPLDELTWGHYRGQPIPASLQSLLTPATTPPTAPPQPPPTVPDTTGTTPGRGRGAGREGDPIANSRPIPSLRLLPGENTRDALRSTPLPTMNGCTFCKRWHLGMSCWTRCQRAASHKHPSSATINTVAAALVAERAAAATAAAATADAGS